MAALGSLGNLVVSLEANMARFNQDMQSAVGVVERSTAKMSEAVAKLREGFETLARAAGLALTLDAVALLQRSGRQVVVRHHHLGLGGQVLDLVGTRLRRQV